MAEKYKKLFEEFPAVSTQQWMDKVTADLKGADFNRRLVWKTNEGIDVQPFYREEDLDKLGYLNSLPGEFPYTRGNKKNNNEWLVRQSIKVNNFADANKKALDYLMKGVNSLAFVFNECTELSVEDLGVLLNDIALDAIEVNFICKCRRRNRHSRPAEHQHHRRRSPVAHALATRRRQLALARLRGRAPANAGQHCCLHPAQQLLSEHRNQAHTRHRAPHRRGRGA